MTRMVSERMSQRKVNGEHEHTVGYWLSSFVLAFTDVTHLLRGDARWVKRTALQTGIVCGAARARVCLCISLSLCVSASAGNKWPQQGVFGNKKTLKGLHREGKH